MRVVVATDGSEVARHAARRALELVREPDELTVVYSSPELPGEDAGGIEGPTETAEEAARQARELDVEALGAIEETVRDLGAIAVDRRVVTGEPGPAICHLADELHADAVVVGSHGRGLLKQMVLGSVSDYVVRHAPCPVLVVRAGADGNGSGG